MQAAGYASEPGKLPTGERGNRHEGFRVAAAATMASGSFGGCSQLVLPWRVEATLPQAATGAFCESGREEFLAALPGCNGGERRGVVRMGSASLWRWYSVGSALMNVGARTPTPILPGGMTLRLLRLG